jgi:DNA-binding IclR family transcriptional regulator
LVRRTPHTNTDPARLRSILREIRTSGYAIENEESEIGMRCIAAPVRDATGAVVAAVGVAGPSQRLSRKAIGGIAPNVVRTARSISARLGHRLKATA